MAPTGRPSRGPVRRQRDRGHAGDVPRRRQRRERLLVLEVRAGSSSSRIAPTGSGSWPASASAPRRTARAPPGSRRVAAHRHDASPNAGPRTARPALGSHRVSGRSSCSLPGRHRPTAPSSPPSRSRRSAPPPAASAPRFLHLVPEGDQQPRSRRPRPRRTSGRTTTSAITGVDEPPDPQPAGLELARGQARRRRGRRPGRVADRAAGEHVEECGASRTVRASGPDVASPTVAVQRGPLIRPRLGLNPTSPQHAGRDPDRARRRRSPARPAPARRRPRRPHRPTSRRPSGSGPRASAPAARRRARCSRASRTRACWSCRG